MKAKDLAAVLLKNPDAIVAVWEGEPNDTWTEVTDVVYQENEFIDNAYRKTFSKIDKVIKLGYSR